MLAYFHKTTVNTGDSFFFFFFFFFSSSVFDFICSIKIVWVVLVSLDSFICLGQTVLRLVYQKACLSLIHGLSVTLTSNILCWRVIDLYQSVVWEKKNNQKTMDPQSLYARSNEEWNCFCPSLYSFFFWIKDFFLCRV